jgi:hypothetical protein
MINPNKENFIKVCQSSKTMSEAARTLNLSFGSFKRFAIKFGCYSPNQGAQGTVKPYKGKNIIPLSEILEGKHPTYGGNRLKLRLIKHSLIDNRCQECGMDPEWNGQPLTLQLHHKNGDSTDHRKENIMILCPNCHTQTDNWGTKNR